MTKHLTMNTVIHAAFRRDLGRFAEALGSFSPGDTKRANDLGRAFDNFAQQLHHHHNDEETIFWPAFTALGVDPGLLEQMDSEHDRMGAALAGAEGAMKAFVADPSKASVEAASAAITELHGALNDHLVHEERDLEPWAAERKKSPEIKKAQVAVRKAHKGGTGTFMAWLQDGAEPDDIAALKHEVPAPVLAVITKIGGRHYRKEIAPVWSLGRS